MGIQRNSDGIITWSEGHGCFQVTVVTERGKTRNVVVTNDGKIVVDGETIEKERTRKIEEGVPNY